MRLLDRRAKSVLFKIGFVASMLLLGWGAEFGYQTLSHRTGTHRQPSMKEGRILLIGGSILDSGGFSRFLQHQLRERFPDRPIDITSTGFIAAITPDNIRNYYSALVKKGIRSDIVGVMFTTCEERWMPTSDIVQKKIAPKFAYSSVQKDKIAKIRKEIVQLKVDYDGRPMLDAKESKAYAVKIYELAQEIYTQVFPNFKIEWITLKPLRPEDLGWLDRQIFQLAVRAAESLPLTDNYKKRMEYLLGLGHRIRRQMIGRNLWGDHNEKAFYQSRIKDLSGWAKTANKHAKEALKKIQKSGCDVYMLHDSFFVPYNRIYMCVMARFRTKFPHNQISLFDNALSLNSTYQQAVEMPLAFASKDLVIGLPYRDYELGNLHSDHKKREIKMWSDSETRNDISSHMKQFKESVDRHGAALVFIQAPNFSSGLVTNSGKQLGVSVIDPNERLKAAMEGANYFDYFSDYVCDSGHLTDKGAALYAKLVADEMAALWKGKDKHGSN